MKSSLVFAGFLVLVACKNSSSGPPSTEVAQARPVVPGKISKDKAIEVASAEAVKLNLSPRFLEEMSVEATLGPAGWNVVFSPKRQNMYGGGLRVLVDKESGAVVRTLIGQ